MGKTKRVFIILKEFLGSREFHFGKPRIFFSGVSFPLDKVVLTGQDSFMANDLLDFIVFFIINKIRGWSREVPSVNFIFMIRRKKRSVEYVVNFP